MNTSAANRPERSRITCSRTCTAVAASMACFAFVTAACGKTTPGPRVAALTSTTSTAASGPSAAAATATASLLAYSQCMRAHGVPDFPDPVGDSLRINGSPGSDLSPDSPQFVTAASACKALAPTSQGGHVTAKDQAGALKYAACMRSHGVPDFADPVFKNGGIQQQVNGDPNSPQFKAADKACAQYQPIGRGGQTTQNSDGPAAGNGVQKGVGSP
jgi:hypothetical protein